MQSYMNPDQPPQTHSLREHFYCSFSVLPCLPIIHPSICHAASLRHGHVELEATPRKHRSQGQRHHSIARHPILLFKMTCYLPVVNKPLVIWHAKHHGVLFREYLHIKSIWRAQGHSQLDTDINQITNYNYQKRWKMNDFWQNPWRPLCVTVMHACALPCIRKQVFLSIEEFSSLQI